MLETLPDELKKEVIKYLALKGIGRLRLVDKALKKSAEAILTLKYPDPEIPNIVFNWAHENPLGFREWFKKDYLEQMKSFSKPEKPTKLNKQNYLIYAIYYFSLVEEERRGLSLLDEEFLRDCVMSFLRDKAFKKPPELFFDRNQLRSAA